MGWDFNADWDSPAGAPIGPPASSPLTEAQRRAKRTEWAEYDRTTFASNPPAAGTPFTGGTTKGGRL